MAAVDPNGFPTPVAPNQIIESAWGNATVTKLREAHDRASQYLQSTFGIGSANVDATGGATYAVWLNVGNFTPPAWAKTAVVHSVISGVAGITADSDYFLKMTCNADGAEFLHSGTLNKRAQIVLLGSFAITPSVVNAAVVAARRVGGTGFIRYTSGSTINTAISFSPT